MSLRAAAAWGLALAMLSAAPAIAGKYDPNALPTIGGTAPAFSLEAFRERGEDEAQREIIQLDDQCGPRGGDTTMVLLAFVNNDSANADFSQLTKWQRRYERSGLVSIAISTDRGTAEMGELVAKAKRPFRVLDDKFAIVAQRYGIDGAPFTLLLDADCRVLGMADKSASSDADRLQAAIDERAKMARAK